jgi:hypothetical protein
MSWLAEKNATASAQTAVAKGAEAGSLRPMPAIDTASPSWVARAQPRRRPRRRVRSGIGAWSIAGAHTNFQLYGRPTRAKSPIVWRSTPTSRSHQPRVPRVSSSGSPLEKPMAKISAMRRSW